jgi:hypothetical protein
VPGWRDHRIRISMTRACWIGSLAAWRITVRADTADVPGRRATRCVLRACMAAVARDSGRVITERFLCIPIEGPIGSMGLGRQPLSPRPRAGPALPGGGSDTQPTCSAGLGRALRRLKTRISMSCRKRLFFLGYKHTKPTQYVIPKTHARVS